MKKIFLTITFLGLLNILFAQAPLGKGNAQINAGLGFSSVGIPIYGGLDYGVHEDVTIGGQLSFAGGKSYTNNGYHYKQSIFGIAVNGNYHFNTLLNMPSEWNFYAGLNLGFYFYNYTNDYDGDGASTGLGLQVGGRYFFNDKFGLNLELGGGTVYSGGKFGITVIL